MVTPGSACSFTLMHVHCVMHRVYAPWCFILLFRDQLKAQLEEFVTNKNMNEQQESNNNDLTAFRFRSTTCASIATSSSASYPREWVSTLTLASI